ncbi:MAG: hypothetical protein IH608_10265, partial [Proteobacteria bacterium]|nr:hypothetical protein [Pseudomonadota bacterium]
MTDTALATKERLTALAEGAVPEAVRALWIETLPAGDGLAELFGKHDDLSLLQKARFLLDLGRHEDAREVLGEVQGTRPGLRQVRDALVSALAGPVRVGEPG